MRYLGNGLDLKLTDKPKFEILQTKERLSPINRDSRFCLVNMAYLISPTSLHSSMMMEGARIRPAAMR